MTTGPPIARPRTLAGLGASWRLASAAKIACSIIVAPRPPYSFGQEIPAQPAACSFSCHSRRKAITSSSPASGSGPGWFSCSQVRTSSRNSSSDGDSVRSIGGAAYRGCLAGWPGSPRTASPRLEFRAVFEPVALRHLDEFFEGGPFAGQRRARIRFQPVSRRLQAVDDFLGKFLVACRRAEGGEFFDRRPQRRHRRLQVDLFFFLFLGEFLLLLFFFFSQVRVHFREQLLVALGDFFADRVAFFDVVGLLQGRPAHGRSGGRPTFCAIPARAVFAFRAGVGFGAF